MKKLLYIFAFFLFTLGIVQFTYGVSPSDQSIPGADYSGSRQSLEPTENESGQSMKVSGSTQPDTASASSMPERGTSPVHLPQTGAKTSYAKGDDGDLERGVAWPNPRFKVAGDCVTDNLTGLIWAKNANLINGIKEWSQALDYADTLTLCGYSDWRLPNVNEIETLIDAAQPKVAIWLNGEGFVNVQPGSYWSSTTFDHAKSYAWIVSMQFGNVGNSKKVTGNYVWPVRTGQ